MQNELGPYIDIDNNMPTISVVHMPNRGTQTCGLVGIAHTKSHLGHVKEKRPTQDWQPHGPSQHQVGSGRLHSKVKWSVVSPSSRGLTH